ncbi:MAG: hypothetical protein ABI647_07745 [Gemmatimonadota bacterium]
MNTPRKAARRLGGKAAGSLRSAAAFLLLGGGGGLTIGSAQTIAITGGTVFPVSGPKIEHGTVVITNGKISAVGAAVTVPAGATTIDATGKWVTPGLIHAGANAGAGVANLGGFGEAISRGTSTHPSICCWASIRGRSPSRSRAPAE